MINKNYNFIWNRINNYVKLNLNFCNNNFLKQQINSLKKNNKRMSNNNILVNQNFNNNKKLFQR